jgi:hypothetical protein
VTIGEEAVELARSLDSELLLQRSQWMLGLACLSTDHARATRLIEECIRNDIGLHFALRTWDLLACAQVQLANGEHANAIATLRDCLTCARQWGDRFVTPPALLAIARAFRRLDRPEISAGLLGASEGQRERGGIAGGPADARARERLEAQLRETLGDEQFETQFDAGRAFEREESIIYALDVAADAAATTV